MNPVAPRRATTRVLLVDDHAVVRRSLRRYLEALDVTVAEAEDGAEALDLLNVLDSRGELPDVVLMDLLMPVLDGVTTTGRVTRRYPGIRVIVLTGFGSIHRIEAALANGASGYLLKDVEPEILARMLLKGTSKRSANHRFR